MSYENYITIAVIALIAIPSIIFVIRGISRGIVKALMTTGNIALSAFLACFLSRDLTTIARDYIYPIVEWIVGMFGISLEELFGDVQGLATLLPVLVAIMITPFLFLVFFFVLRTIIGIILSFFHKPKRKTVNEDGETVKVKRHVPVWSRICGGIVGVVNGILLVFVITVPMVGYANLALHVSNEYYKEIDTSVYLREESQLPNVNAGSIYFAVQDYLVPATENAFFKVGYNTLGNTMFTYLTSTAYDKDEIVLETEAIAAIHLLQEGSEFAKTDFMHMDETTVQSMRNIVNSVDESVLMPEMTSILISNACQKWENGEAFLGMSAPTLGEDNIAAPFVDEVIAVLAQTDRELLIDDLNVLIDILDLFLENKVFERLQNLSDFDNADDPKALLTELEGVADSITEILSAHEQWEGLSIKLNKTLEPLKMLIALKDVDFNDPALKASLTESVNKYKDEPAQLSQNLKQNLEDHLKEQGVDARIDSELYDSVAESISNEIAGREDLSEEEVKDIVKDTLINQYADADGYVDLNQDGQPDININDFLDR